jgi:hypothetical protein
VQLDNLHSRLGRTIHRQAPHSQRPNRRLPHHDFGFVLSACLVEELIRWKLDPASGGRRRHGLLPLHIGNVVTAIVTLIGRYAPLGRHSWPRSWNGNVSGVVSKSAKSYSLGLEGMHWRTPLRSIAALATLQAPTGRSDKVSVSSLMPPAGIDIGLVRNGMQAFRNRSVSSCPIPIGGRNHDAKPILPSRGISASAIATLSRALIRPPGIIIPL